MPSRWRSPWRRRTAVPRGFLADAQARERLRGGSITLDGRLILIAALEDLRVVKRFVTEIGGDLDDATIPGRPARVRRPAPEKDYRRGSNGVEVSFKPRRWSGR